LVAAYEGECDLGTGAGGPPLVGVRLHGRKRRMHGGARRIVLTKLPTGLDRGGLPRRLGAYAEGEPMREEVGGKYSSR